MVERRLRAVTAADKAAPVKPKTVTQAAVDGSLLELLTATRDRIAVAVEDPNTPARDLAALTKRLLETVREIESIDAREAEDVASEREVSDGQFDASAV